jgi:predicted  nucleic acid-binding Zn-ribbon protein
MDVDDRLVRQEMEIETIRHGLEDVQAALDSVASRLNQLSEGQDALELQTALLSKAAEDNGFVNETVFARAPGDPDPPNEALDGLRQQLDRLTQGLQTTTGRADSRIEALVTSGQRLEHEVADLRTRVSALKPADSNQPPETASGTGTATDKMLRTLVDEASALKTAGGMTHDRIVRLEKRGSGLQDTLNALSLQQVRTDYDSRQLRRHLKRLLVLTTASVLLIGAVLAWLVVPRLGAEYVIETAESTEDAGQWARDQVAELRLAVSLLEDSVDSVTRTVDKLISAPQHESRLVEQLDALRTRIEALREAQKQAADAGTGHGVEQAADSAVTRYAGSGPESARSTDR